MILHLWVMAFIAGIYLRPGELIPALATVPLMDILAGGGALIALASIALKPRFPKQPHDLFFLGFYAIMVSSNPLNGFFGAAFASLTNFSTVAAAYVLVRLANTTPQQIRRTAVALTVLTTFLAVNGLLQIYTGMGLGGVTAADTRAGVRIMGTGIFADANDLGMAMVTVVPFVLSVVLGRSSFLSRICNALVLAVLLLACYYTNSRGTIIGLGVVFSIFAFRRFGWFTAGTLSAIGFAAILLFGPSRMSEVGTADASSQGRIQAWAAAIDMFQISPFWGVGHGQFMQHHERVAHNSLMHVLGELGIVGAVMFVGMFYWYFVGLRPALTDAAGPDRATAKSPTPRGKSSARLAAGQSQPAEAAPRDAATRRGGRSSQGNLADEDVQFIRRLARDLSDCGIGMLACAMFLSRQYTVTLFIPLALSASLAAAMAHRPQEEKRGIGATMHLLAVPALTLTMIVAVWVGVRVFVRY
jgi:putative inorganic carbon (hco3(-)) transporter